MTTIDERLDRLEHLLLSQYHLINFWSSKIMSDFATVKQALEQAAAAAAIDRQEAVEQRALAEQAVGLLQSLSASIAALKEQIAAGTAATPEQMDELLGIAGSINTNLAASRADSDAAETTLSDGVAAATPAEPTA